MRVESSTPAASVASPPVLQAYLLGTVDFEAALGLQRRLVYEVSGDRGLSALLLCEHPPLITVGRQGSFTHLLCEPRELEARRWRVRWVNRGGGCLLHTPGQLAVYPVLPLNQFGLGLHAYLERLQQVLVDTLADFGVRAESRPDRPGVWAGGRLVAEMGVAVRDWVAYYGAYLNVNPALEPFRLVRCGGAGEAPMTSLERERRGPLRPGMVRERMLEHFTARFAFGRVALFSDHPSLSRKASPDALPSRA
jgi:lipoyl(octanoyl) transferase